MLLTIVFPVEAEKRCLSMTTLYRALQGVRIALSNPGHGVGIQGATIQKNDRSPPTIVGIHDGFDIPILDVVLNGVAMAMATPGMRLFNAPSSTS